MSLAGSAFVDIEDLESVPDGNCVAMVMWDSSGLTVQSHLMKTSFGLVGINHTGPTRPGYIYPFSELPNNPEFNSKRYIDVGPLRDPAEIWQPQQ